MSDEKNQVTIYLKGGRSKTFDYTKKEHRLPPTPNFEARRKRKGSIVNSNALGKKRSLPNTLTMEEWEHALNYFNGCCAVCNRPLIDLFNTHKISIDHWIPLSYKGDDNPGTVATNIVPLCFGFGGCNNRKCGMMPGVWLKQTFSTYKAKQIATRIQEYFDSLK